jgi:hypothetical protein
MDLARIKYGFWVVLLGIGALVFIYVVAFLRWTTASDIAALVGSAGGVIGTIVGAFFGVHTGAVGKERAEEQRDTANSKLQALLGITPPQEYERLRKELPNLFPEYQMNPKPASTAS